MGSCPKSGWRDSECKITVDAGTQAQQDLRGKCGWLGVAPARDARMSTSGGHLEPLDLSLPLVQWEMQNFEVGEDVLVCCTAPSVLSFHSMLEDLDLMGRDCNGKPCIEIHCEQHSPTQQDCGKLIPNQTRVSKSATGRRLTSLYALAIPILQSPAARIVAAFFVAGIIRRCVWGGRL